MEPDNRPDSPKDPARPLHRPPSPPPAGFDNQGYTPDSADPNHNDSFTSKANGHAEKIPEAVNLELINLKPQNGQNGNTKSKKDVEVDMNATNPYDEYFVPVNEHRKYMRGEKLYVTQDKRNSEKSGCKRPLCWTMLCLVVAAVVVLIVLAATGVLFANSPTPVEQYNSSISSARALGGLAHDRSHDHDHSHDNDHNHHDHQEDHKHEDSQSDQEYAVSQENTDASYYVPHTLEGELKIDNEQFDQQMEDLDSEAAQELRRTFADALRAALFDRSTLDNGDHDINVEVVNIRKGSIIVTYRIHWVPKKNTEKELDLDAETLRRRLEKYLARNDRMISTYHIADDKVDARPVLDLCQVNKNDCEYGCEFDDSTLEFSCTCPVGQIVIGRNAKKCESILDGLQNTQTSTAVPAGVNNNTAPVNSNFDWKVAGPPPTEPSTEAETDLNFSHIFGGLQRESTSKPEPAPEPNVEPETELTSISELDSVTMPPSANPEPEPTSEPSSEPEPNAEPKSEPEQSTEPKSEPEPTSEPKSEPEPTSEPKSEPEPTSEPKLGPEPTSEPKPEPEPAAEPKSEPEPISEPEPTPEPKAEPEPAAEPKSSQPKPEPTSEPKSEPESSAESKSELEPTSLTVMEAVEPEPTAEPTTEHLTESAPESKPEPTSERESNDSASYESETERQSTSKSEPEPTAEPKLEPEPTSEPKSETEPKTRVELKPTSVAQSQPEQKPDPDLVSIIGLHKVEESFDTTMRMSTSEPDVMNEQTTYEPKPKIVSIFGDTKDVHEISTTNNYETYSQNDDEDNEPSHTATNPLTTEKVVLSVTPADDIVTIASEKKIPEATTESEVNETIMKAIQEKISRLDEARQLNLNESGNESNQKKEQDLMNVVTSNPNIILTTTETSTEPAEVTFDAIHKIHSTPIDEVMPEPEATTTESSEKDWLAQTVSEIGFDDPEQKPKATTVATTVKADEVMLNKEDFEPDYLSLDPTTKKGIVEDTLYMSMGMPHDYDSEDPRKKRTDPAQDIETSTQAMTIETTSIGQFIYKSAEQTKKATKILSEPAPVWEEGDSERGIYNMQKHQDIFSGEVKTQETLIDKLSPTDVSRPATENVRPANNETNNSEINLESPNLNVTIYEVPSNSSFPVPKTATTTQSAEYEDHETEMNPFLPEVENNKSLVKKLQEGHDLEPVNLNETQNENPEEAVLNEKANENNATGNTEETTSFEDFMANTLLKPAENETDYMNAVEESMNEKGDKETSTFLLDTVDLVTTKKPDTQGPVTESKDDVDRANRDKVSFDNSVVTSERPSVFTNGPNVSDEPKVHPENPTESSINLSSVSSDNPAIISEKPSESSDSLYDDSSAVYSDSPSEESSAVSSVSPPSVSAYSPDVLPENPAAPSDNPALSSENPAESSNNLPISTNSPAVTSDSPTESSSANRPDMSTDMPTASSDRPPVSNNSPAFPKINIDNEQIDEDDEYLSVVPIENEPNKKLNKSNFPGINDISDSPKKSDRRTFDANKLDADRNEA